MMSWQDVANLHALAALNWGLCTAALTQAIDELEIMRDNLDKAGQLLHNYTRDCKVEDRKDTQ